ncbi:hypothetical protein Plec18167_002515 [Paecilomyces lecythidis]|uniref:NmrA-like domain-containing protein n=1 Tax=Paecilomyces lecythidis TaxID=3004212 RepID=A0ABR3Y6E0_9EURO
MSKLIVVIGATGGQGSGVARAFLQDSEFRVRGLTRNPNSHQARKLAAEGIEMVEANIDNEHSLERAFQDAHAIFAFTDYYQHFFQNGKEYAMQKEFAQGVNIARAAAKIPTLKSYVFSTLPYTSLLTQGQAIVPHFEGKGKASAYIQENLPDLYQKTTFCIFTIFAENMILYPIFKPIWVESAKKYIQLWPTPPSTPYLSIGDHRINSGVFVRAIVKNPPPNPGTYVRCNVEDLTLDSMLALWGRASGISPTPDSTAAVEISQEQYVQLWGAMGEEQGSQWKFFKFVRDLGIDKIPGVTMLEGLDLLNEEERTKLVTTEQALKSIDWKASGYVASIQASKLGNL